jgi:ketosteroid isomerase-like protein
MKPWAGRIALCAIIGVLGFFIYHRYFVSEEAKVRKVVMALKDAVEKNDRIKFSDAIAVGYSDEWGWDKTTLIAGFSTIQQFYAEPKVNISELTVTVKGDEAEAAMFVEVTAKDFRGSTQDLTQELRGNIANRLRLKFTKTSDGWKLKSAESIKLRFD